MTEQELRDDFMKRIRPEAPHTEDNFQAHLRMCARFGIDPKIGYLMAKQKMLAAMDFLEEMWDAQEP